MTIQGVCRSVKFGENRPDLVIVGVDAGAESNVFDCKTQDVTLDGAPATSPGAIAEFVTSRHVRAVVADPDYARAAGYVPCESVALFTVY